jgi:hypothetical protein
LEGYLCTQLGIGIVAVIGMTALLVRQLIPFLVFVSGRSRSAPYLTTRSQPRLHRHFPPFPHHPCRHPYLPTSANHSSSSCALFSPSRG